jgi:hypothetical protein
VAGEFRATSDGREVSIAGLSTDRQPLALAVVLDTTASAALYGSKDSRRAIADAIGKSFRDGQPAKIWVGGLAATMRLEGPVPSAATPLRPIVDRMFARKDEESSRSVADLGRALDDDRAAGSRVRPSRRDRRHRRQTSGNVTASPIAVLCLSRVTVSVIAESGRQVSRRARTSRCRCGRTRASVSSPRKPAGRSRSTRSRGRPAPK